MLAFITLSPFILAFLVPLLLRWTRNQIGWATAILPVIIFAILLSYLPQVARGEAITEIYNWVPALGITFSLYLDGLGLLFALLISGVGIAVTVYSIKYLGKDDLHGNFFAFILLFMGSMLGVALTGNLIAIYVFWELTSFSSFLLIGFWFHREPSRYGALKSLLITVFGGFAMLAGFVLIYLLTGTFEIREIIAQSHLIKESPLYPVILTLVLLGAFTKSCQFPFHIWLPNAMEAPTSVSCYLHSATMVKAGLYLLARFTPILGGTPEWFWVVSGVGIFTLVYGSFMAIRQNDLKAMLAFSTISQLGLICALIGFSTELAIAAGLFHLFNHSAFKGGLFLMVGIVDHETGTRDIRELGGLARKLPYTAAVAGIGALAMAGIPPLNGFISKEMLFEAAVQLTTMPGGWLFPVLAVLGSIFTFTYCMKLFFGVFFGEYKKTPKAPHEPPLPMLVPAMVMISLCLVFGLAPGLAAPLVGAAASGTMDIPVTAKLYLWHGIDVPLLMSLLVIIVGAVLALNFERVKAFVESVQQEKFNLNNFYDWSLVALNKTGVYLTYMQPYARMSGYLRDYLVFILLWFVVAVGGTMLLRGGYAFQMDLAPVTVYELLLVGLLLISAMVMVLVPARLPAVIALGVSGFAVALLFLVFRAPDLALTQLIVETVTMVLFLLVFARLPQLKKEIIDKRSKAVNLLVAVSGGIVATFIVIITNAGRQFDSISYYFFENSYILAGGKNIVNVILVDFRGLDTLGEIVVLGIAAFAVVALIKLKKKGEEADNGH